MTPRRTIIAPHLLPVLAAVCFSAVPMAYAEPPAPVPQAGTAPVSGVWNARTTPHPKEPRAAEETRMKVRVYDGFDAHRPGDDDTPLAVDADIGVVTCADGGRRVTDVVIGGSPVEATGGCRDTRGVVRHDDGTGRNSAAAAGPGPGEATPAPRCDPATWHCADPAAPEKPAAP
ncbi:MAG: hypothetical protein IT486_09105 [Gammaproteobacteria bacterium]|nr:hypothetical protein [Gammaproteobacteria bacterium]